MVRVLINVPKRVKRGEAFDVKLLISHPMESGQRRDAMGQAIPRDIINTSSAPTTMRRCCAPTCSLPSPRIHSCRSPSRRKRAAR